MLSENFFVENTDKIVELYNQYTDSIIRKMAYEIKGLGELDDVGRQANLVLRANEVYDDMVAKLSKLTRYSKENIDKLLKNAGVETLKYDDEIYKKAGFNPAPISQSPELLQIMQGIALNTNEQLENLVRTSARATSNNFLNTLNQAQFEVLTGAKDYNMAIRDATKKLASYGTIIEYPSGVKAQLDVVVRRATLTSVKDVANNFQVTRAEEFQAPYADTDAHGGARPTHAEWQGQRFCLIGSKNDGTGKYLNFYTDNFGSEGRPVFEQLKDPNCRHSWYPVMFDDEEIAYNPKEVAKLNSQKVVDHNGKTYTIYEAEQRLRQMERTVRKYKRQANALEIVGLDNSFEKAKIKKWNYEIYQFVKATKLQRRQFNEQVFY